MKAISSHESDLLKALRWGDDFCRECDQKDDGDFVRIPKGHFWSRSFGADPPCATLL